MIHELRCWENSKQDGGQGEVCGSEPVLREQGENLEFLLNGEGVVQDAGVGVKAERRLARLGTCHEALDSGHRIHQSPSLVRPQCHTTLRSPSSQPLPCPRSCHHHP